MSRTPTFDIGDVVELEASFSEDGVAVDPGTVSCTVQPPNGGKDAQLTPEVSGSGGTYTTSIEITQSGTWHYAFDGTPPHKASEEGVFKVRARQVSR
jgi:hypothetical protein